MVRADRTGARRRPGERLVHDPADAAGGERATPRERAFISAAGAFFLEPAGTDYWLRIRRWEEASAAVHAAFPTDDEATLFHALAHLATAPSNTVSRSHADTAAALLTGVLARQPDHPGAMHYLVHANDVPGRERLQTDTVRRYERVAPRNPHALHMPTHIYTRLGDGGDTHLGDMSRARKTSPRVVAYGDVDELNSALGVARAEGLPEGVDGWLRLVQNDLFDLGADLCVPPGDDEQEGARLRVAAAQVERLERWCDEVNETLGAILDTEISPELVPGE